MSTTRLLLRSCKPLRHVSPSAASSSSSSVSTLKCQAKASGLGGEKKGSGSGSADLGDKRKSDGLAVKAAATRSLITLDPPANDEDIVDLASLLPFVRNALVKVLTPPVQPKSWKLHLQFAIEKAIIDCRFFTLFAVMGSLLGSVLCFVEGCVLIVESYIHYFSITSHSSDQGHMVHLLIEAIDMYLIGTALFIFGVGLYAIFVGSENMKKNASASNLFGHFFLRSLPTWVQMDSVSEAKSKIGHAILMILQVGLLDKFKNVPLLTSLDLACFAGTVLISSASIFLLSKLSVLGKEQLAKQG
ncbi:uncharacterized protein [Euphorbia lathyris]|uniref:uncharacterized protein n=1 Tax=Euphorbia lathyris TaxID=212925 RepID=UPI0033139608